MKVDGTAPELVSGLEIMACPQGIVEADCELDGRIVADCNFIPTTLLMCQEMAGACTSD